MATMEFWSFFVALSTPQKRYHAFFFSTHYIFSPLNRGRSPVPSQFQRIATLKQEHKAHASSPPPTTSGSRSTGEIRPMTRRRSKARSKVFRLNILQSFAHWSWSWLVPSPSPAWWWFSCSGCWSLKTTTGNNSAAPEVHLSPAMANLRAIMQFWAAFFSLLYFFAGSKLAQVSTVLGERFASGVRFDELGITPAIYLGLALGKSPGLKLESGWEFQVGWGETCSWWNTGNSERKLSFVRVKFKMLFQVANSVQF